MKSPSHAAGQEHPSGGAGNRLVAAARIAALGAGVLLLALAIPSGAFRPTLLVGGVGLLLLGLLLRSAVRVYGTLGVLALNTLLLLTGIELASTAVLAISEFPTFRALAERFTGTPNDLIKHYRGLAYYVGQPWSERYWSEIGAKPLTPEEKDITTGLDWVLPLTDSLQDLFRETHARIERASRSKANLHDLARVFDGVETPIWIDTWGHTVPPGNRLVANEIAKTLEDFSSSRN